MGRQLAMLRLAKTRQETDKKFSPEALDLLDFVPTISPRLERPDHLALIADAFARSCTQEVNVLISCPPQHGKTEIVKHGCVWRLKRDETLPIFYLSYADKYANTQSRSMRDYALRAGVTLREDARSVGEWVTEQGGGVVAGGFAGFTGRPTRLLIVDDPYGKREDAESAAYRAHVLEFFNSVLRIRVHPGGSKIVVHTRWHPSDLIGTLAKEAGWEVINLPAINDRGEALWPSHRPLEYLKRFQEDAYNWASLFMGSPRPRGTEVFGAPSYYDELPKDGYRVTVGVDLAYTEKTRADHSVAIVAAHVLLDTKRPDGTPDWKSYILDVVRMQVRAEDFATALQQIRSTYPGARFHSYVSTTEQGTTGLLNRLGGVPIVGHLAKADKFIRAQPVAAAWNAGRVTLPSQRFRDAHPDRRFDWLQPYIDELGIFTGVKDVHDDQVDATASAYDSARFGTQKRGAAPPVNARGSFDERALFEPKL